MLVALALLAQPAACRSVPAGLADSPGDAVAATDGIFGGVSTRFHRVTREPRVRTARSRISRAALTPSRVFNDTTIWVSSPAPNVRSFTYRGLVEPDGYRMTTDGAATRPARPGENRNDTRLRRISNNEFEWVGVSDYGIGATTPETFAVLPVAWIAAGERDDSTALRAEMHAVFPRSTREWGRVFALASLESTRDPSGAWRQRRVVVMRPSGAEQLYPKFAKWLRDNVGPMRIRIRLTDSVRTWFDFSYRDDTLVILTRSRGGRLVPLHGGDAPMPDTVTFEADFSTKVSFFRVGFHQLRGDFVTVREPDARGWSFRFAREPEWDLPLFTERMIRTPLRRPFQGGGIQFRIAATRDASGGQTLLTRRLVAFVQESAIIRFISGLANVGVGSYVDGADVDTNRWLTIAFAALRDDSRALLTPR
jgi:hypothetical protein